MRTERVYLEQQYLVFIFPVVALYEKRMPEQFVAAARQEELFVYFVRKIVYIVIVRERNDDVRAITLELY